MTSACENEGMLQLRRQTATAVSDALGSLGSLGTTEAFVKAAMEGEHGQVGILGSQLGYPLGKLLFGDA